MLIKKYFASVGLLFLIIGCFLPIAWLNEDVISIFPVWNNIKLHNGLWQWLDISFFAITIALIILINLYLILKNKYKGLIATGILSIFICIIIFAALLQVQSKVTGISGITFSFSLGLIIIPAGGILSIISGSNIFDKK